jgi:cyclophilin family peptidyl-prolyl cis-trans isomerase
MLIKVMMFTVVLLAVASAGTARAENPIVAVETSLGTFKVELFENKAPITVKNFLGYVDDKFYDGTIFHRVIDRFMIQGGGLEPGMKPKKAKPPITNEAANGLSNLRGTITMARTDEPHSATSQFFINVADNIRLDQARSPDRVGYCVFGRVLEGMDVVDKITKVERSTNDMGEEAVPKTDVVIKTVRRVEKK